MVLLLALVMMELLIFSETLVIAVPHLLAGTLHRQRLMGIAVLAFPIAQDSNRLVVERELLLLPAVDFDDHLIL